MDAYGDRCVSSAIDQCIDAVGLIEIVVGDEGFGTSNGVVADKQSEVVGNHSGFSIGDTGG